ncbi:copper transpport protein [Dimargaris cristalligena]|nr:copper transpport protein [Dimargaris cristalligena]
MNMAFNWETKNVCVLFESWRIDSPESLIFSCLAVVILAAGYEFSKKMFRRWEWHALKRGFGPGIRRHHRRHHHRRHRDSGDSHDPEAANQSSSSATPPTGWNRGENSEDEVTGTGQDRQPQETDTMVPVRGRPERHAVSAKRRTNVRVTRAVLYSLQVFYSFFLMLIFMTYNWYLVISVVVGTAIGHFFFASDEMAGFRSMSCH